MKRFITLAVLSAVAGCTGVEGETYLGRPGSPAWFSTASPATIADHFSRLCAAYGFRPGTPEMASCIQKEAAVRRQESAMLSASNAAMAQARARMMTQNQSPQITIRPPIHCTTSSGGYRSVNTTCW